ncbi:MAG: FG-GAP repeat protein [Planctomycetes bacterium]|nr:FG-GAP repeat protein [Planctomycetota bacterium]
MKLAPLPILVSALGFSYAPGLAAQGNALSLASGSRVTTAHSTALVPATITVEAWVVPKEHRGFSTIVRKNPVDLQDSYSLRIEGGYPSWVVLGASGFLTNKSTTSLTLGKPVHIAGTYDGTTSRLYIDGALDQEIKGTVGALQNTGGDLVIGQGVLNGFHGQFVGSIDELRIWNVVRTATEISEWRSNKVHVLDRQVATFHFDGNASDATGSHHGTAFGAATYIGQFVQQTRVGRVFPDAKGAPSVIAAIGDFDGDGYRDWAIGDPQAAIFQSGDGMVHLVSGRDHKPFLRLLPPRANVDLFGSSLGSGDFNQDGFDDVMIGTPGSPNELTVAYGGNKGLAKFVGASVSATFIGTELAVGHFDAVAGPDVVTCELHGATWRLRALRGSNAADLWNVVLPDRPGSMVSIPDVSGDGRDDVLIGMPWYDNASIQDSGRVEARSGLDGSLLWSKTGVSTSERFGWAVCALGDVDADGINEVVVGSPFASGGQGNFIFYSGVNGFYMGGKTGQAGQQLGYALTCAGDVDRDGVLDLLVSSLWSNNRGSIEIRSGRTKGAIGPWISPGSNDFGLSVARGDTNGDSVPDFFVADGIAGWAFDGDVVPTPPSWTTFGQSCRGTGNVLPRIWGSDTSAPNRLDGAAPRLPGTLNLFLSSGARASIALLHFGFGRTHVPLDAIGMNGCALNVGTKILSLGAPTDGSGGARLPIALPNAPQYVGVQLSFEWLVFDPSANAFGLTLSDAAEIRLGPKL